MSYSAYIDEVFPTIQGESSLVGLPFLFVRLAGCNLKCEYCDSVGAQQQKPDYQVFPRPFQKDFHVEKNPATTEGLLETIRAYNIKRISFTGGEPLLQHRFLESIIDQLINRFILIETNGSLPGAVTELLLKKVNIWSVDIKLPSVCGFDITETHLKFLEKLGKAEWIDLKSVFSPETPESEIQTALELAEFVHLRNPKSRLFFQPVTKDGAPLIGKNFETIWELSRKAPFEVRILPQVHPLFDIK